ncbi:MAG: DUF4124 domain-containing protein [Burkholderiales bacterium]
MRFLILLAISTMFAPLPAMAAFKCQGADGKVEYSDRPCDTSKNTVNAPNANKGIQSRPAVNPMDQLEKLFTDFRPRLCEREALSAELDRANRSGEFGKQVDVWKPKQDKLLELNDVMVDFQQRASKITKPSGNDSKEMAALRKFQAGLKECIPPAPVAATPPAPTAPAKPK